eukprot:1867064-Rhodomonas_salina.1
MQCDSDSGFEGDLVAGNDMLADEARRSAQCERRVGSWEARNELAKVIDAPNDRQDALLLHPLQTLPRRLCWTPIRSPHVVFSH